MMDRLRLREDIPGHTHPTEPSAHASINDAGRLTVGREISLSGEIGSCHDLMVEGTVQAELKDGVNIEISETGLFKGNVQVQNADISGRFEGTLIVQNQLIIRPNAQISGTIEYGIIEIHPGARVDGTMTARVIEQPVEHVVETPVQMESDPVADQNPGASADREMLDIISRIEESEGETSGALPFRQVANG